MKRKNTDAQGGDQPGTRQLDDPIIEGLLEGNLLPADKFDVPLPFKVPEWPNHAPSPGTPEKLQGFWGDAGLDLVEFQTPGTFPFELTVPVSRLVEGQHTLRYQVTIGADAPQRSADIPINIDKTPPQLVAPDVLDFPQRIKDEGVTSDYLMEFGKVDVVLPPNQSPAEGDYIEVYWDTTENENNEVSRRTVGAGDVGQEILLTFPADKLIESGNGARKARYRICDFVGNPSGFSTYVDVTVALDDDEDGGEIPNLQPMEFYPGEIVDPADGTLHKDVVLGGGGLRMLIPQWNVMPIPGRTDHVHIDLAPGHGPHAPVWEEVIVYPVNGSALPTFPLELILEDARLHPDIAFRLRYRVLTWNSNEPNFSPVERIIADTTPPWGIALPAAPGIPNDNITDDYLTANPAGIACTVPPYDDFQVTDKGAYWYLSALPEDPADLLDPTGYFNVTEVPLTFHVPEEVVRAVGDGGCYLVYMLSDKATNMSLVSRPTRLKVALDALPTGLLVPEAPQAAVKGEIDLLDVAAGVIVEIPEFANWKPTDKIRLKWGNVEMQAQDIGTNPNWPRQVGVPDGVVKLEYGDGQGAVETKFSYTIYRGDVVFGPEENAVNVNLSVAGPVIPDPDWPGPINPGLGVAQVFGNTSNVLNTLDRQDTGQPAKFVWPMYTPAVAGEEVNFYWGDTLVEAARYEVTGNEAAGDPLTAIIPWDIIKATGNNTGLLVHYRIGHPDSPNEQHSATTTVVVDAVALTLPPATFPDAVELSGGPILNCQSLFKPQNSIRVQTPDLSAYVAVGDIVKLKWIPYHKVIGAGGEEITEAILEGEHEVLAGEETGFIWEVMPYEDHILPTYVDGSNPAGHASVQFWITYAGHEESSELVLMDVGMFDGNSSCPLDTAE